eukprot:TRINITY_DN6673_c0_g2_i2.p1 TRINITY_DN6673_c0_g2~~TRINITY_DN6673_c0_g2_i2.p1  ORF type:complete len:1431 (+),score=213.92 TRINITY_DN6673_c0_g2_i2:1846-6138(+)
MQANHYRLISPQRPRNQTPTRDEGRGHAAYLHQGYNDRQHAPGDHHPQLVMQLQFPEMALSPGYPLSPQHQYPMQQVVAQPRKRRPGLRAGMVVASFAIVAVAKVTRSITPGSVDQLLAELERRGVPMVHKPIPQPVADPNTTLLLQMLEREREERKQEVKDLKETVLNMSTAGDQQSEVSKLRSELDDERAQSTATIEKIQREATEKETTLRSQIEELRDAVSTLQANSVYSKNVEDEASELKELVRTLSNDLGERDEALANISRKSSILEAQNSTNNMNLQRATERVQDLQKMLGEKDKLIVESEKIIQELNKTVEDKNAVIKQLQRELYLKGLGSEPVLHTPEQRYDDIAAEAEGLASSYHSATLPTRHEASVPSIQPSRSQYEPSQHSQHTPMHQSAGSIPQPKPDTSVRSMHASISRYSETGDAQADVSMRSQVSHHQFAPKETSMRSQGQHDLAQQSVRSHEAPQPSQHSQPEQHTMRSQYSTHSQQQPHTEQSVHSAHEASGHWERGDVQMQADTSARSQVSHQSAPHDTMRSQMSQHQSMPQETSMRSQVSQHQLVPQETSMRSQVSQHQSMPQETSMRSQVSQHQLVPQETSMRSQMSQHQSMPQETSMRSQVSQHQSVPQETSMRSQESQHQLMPQETSMRSQHQSLPQETSMRSHVSQQQLVPQETSMRSQVSQHQSMPQETSMRSQQQSLPQETSMRSQVSHESVPQDTSMRPQQSQPTQQEALSTRSAHHSQLQEPVAQSSVRSQHSVHHSQPHTERSVHSMQSAIRYTEQGEQADTSMISHHQSAPKERSEATHQSLPQDSIGSQAEHQSMPQETSMRSQVSQHQLVPQETSMRSQASMRQHDEYQQQGYVPPADVSDMQQGDFEKLSRLMHSEFADTSMLPEAEHTTAYSDVPPPSRTSQSPHTVQSNPSVHASNPHAMSAHSQPAEQTDLSWRSTHSQQADVSMRSQHSIHSEHPSQPPEQVLQLEVGSHHSLAPSVHSQIPMEAQGHTHTRSHPSQSAHEFEHSLGHTHSTQQPGAPSHVSHDPSMRSHASQQLAQADTHSVASHPSCQSHQTQVRTTSYVEATNEHKSVSEAGDVPPTAVVVQHEPVPSSPASSFTERSSAYEQLGGEKKGKSSLSLTKQSSMSHQNNDPVEDVPFPDQDVGVRSPITPMWGKPVPAWAMWTQHGWVRLSQAPLEAALQPSGVLPIPHETVAEITSLSQSPPIMLEKVRTYDFGLSVFTGDGSVFARYLDTYGGDQALSPEPFPGLWLPAPGALLGENPAYSTDPHSPSLPCPGMLEHMLMMGGQLTEGAGGAWRGLPLRDPTLAKFVLKCKKAPKGEYTAEIHHEVHEVLHSTSTEVAGPLLWSVFEKATANNPHPTPEHIADILSFTLLTWNGGKYLISMQAGQPYIVCNLASGVIYEVWRLDNEETNFF